MRLSDHLTSDEHRILVSVIATDILRNLEPLRRRNADNVLTLPEIKDVVTAHLELLDATYVKLLERKKDRPQYLTYDLVTELHGLRVSDTEVYGRVMTDIVILTTHVKHGKQSPVSFAAFRQAARVDDFAAAVTTKIVAPSGKTSVVWSSAVPVRGGSEQ